MTLIIEALLSRSDHDNDNGHCKAEGPIERLFK